jgi:hypothetical protein
MRARALLLSNFQVVEYRQGRVVRSRWIVGKPDIAASPEDVSLDSPAFSEARNSQGFLSDLGTTDFRRF